MFYVKVYVALGTILRFIYIFMLYVFRSMKILCTYSKIQYSTYYIWNRSIYTYYSIHTIILVHIIINIGSKDVYDREITKGTSLARIKMIGLYKRANLDQRDQGSHTCESLCTLCPLRNLFQSTWERIRKDERNNAVLICGRTFLLHT